MDLQQLEEIGERLRSLGHDRREVVERIVSGSRTGSPEAAQRFQDLDRISEQAISLMERQRSLIREELAEHGQV